MNPPRRLRGTFGMGNLREGFVNLREGFVVAPWRLREAFSKTRSAKASWSPLEGFAKASRRRHGRLHLETIRQIMTSSHNSCAVSCASSPLLRPPRSRPHSHPGSYPRPRSHLCYCSRFRPRSHPRSCLDVLRLPTPPFWFPPRPNHRSLPGSCPRPCSRLRFRPRLQLCSRDGSFLLVPWTQLPPRYDARVRTPGLANGAVG